MYYRLNASRVWAEKGSSGCKQHDGTKFNITQIEIRCTLFVYHHDFEIDGD